MKLHIIPKDYKYTEEEFEERMKTILEEQQYAVLQPLCLVADYKVGDEKQYISQIINLNTVPKIDESIFIAAPTGSGKTKAVIKTIKHSELPVVYLTNRIATLLQFKKDFIKETQNIDVTMNMIDIASLGENIEAFTYQKFADIAYQYRGKEFLLILDEVHCIFEDASFSVYPEKFKRYLMANLDNTSRIYITATPDAVSLPIAYAESYLPEMAIPETINNDSDVDLVFNACVNHKTRMKMIYSVKSNWDYINFKFYSPDDTNELIDYIKQANVNGIKILIYINDINKGKNFQEVLGNTQHVYSKFLNLKTRFSMLLLSTVNDILKTAGITYEVKPKVEIYGISAIDSTKTHMSCLDTAYIALRNSILTLLYLQI